MKVCAINDINFGGRFWQLNNNHNLNSLFPLPTPTPYVTMISDISLNKSVYTATIDISLLKFIDFLIRF